MRNDHIHRQVERSGTEVEVKAIVSRLVEVEAYIREEADFNARGPMDAGIRRGPQTGILPAGWSLPLNVRRGPTQ